MKDRIASKMKQLCCKYRKALDLGEQSGAGRIVFAFYDICNKIGSRLSTTESLKCWIKNTSGGIKAGENDQPEELLNAINGFRHDDNKGENFDNEKHCVTPSEVSMNSMKGSRKTKTTLCILQVQKFSRAN